MTPSNAGRTSNGTRVVIIGGTGHIGSFLTPKLIEEGYRVTCLSRLKQRPYVEHEAWSEVEQVPLDRATEESVGTFGSSILALDPDVVIDLTCYQLESARQLVKALRGRVRQFLHCGTIWVHGPTFEKPTTEAEPRFPIDDYGRRKAAIEEYLLDEFQQTGFPATVLHPGHLVGTGWMPLTPLANFNRQAFADLAAGREIVLPNLGEETLHHVHAADVAQAFVLAIAAGTAAFGQSFHVVSPEAVTLSDYAKTAAGWFGQPARIRCAPWHEWRGLVPEKEAWVTWTHIVRSPNCSIRKAEKLLGYRPRYTSMEAVRESLFWLISSGVFVP